MNVIPDPLSVTGRVFYNDGHSPVRDARVKVVDRDRGPDDVIVDDVTDRNGRFTGSGRWRDEILELLPDLRFEIAADGRTHSGRFVPSPFGHEARLEVPWGRPCAVGRQARQLLLFLVLSDGQSYKGFDKWLYESIEAFAQRLPDEILSPRYADMRVIKGADATADALVDALGQMTSSPGIEAVDLIYVTHGIGADLVFAGRKRMKSAGLASMISAELSDVQRRRLRAVFSTACWGASHIAGWLGAGFAVASGGTAVYADSAVSFAPFLRSWGQGRSFAEAVAAANGDPAATAVWDRLAEAKHKLLKGRTIDANSLRVARGATGLTICDQPR